MAIVEQHSAATTVNLVVARGVRKRSRAFKRSENNLSLPQVVTDIKNAARSHRTKLEVQVRAKGHKFLFRKQRPARIHACLVDAKFTKARCSPAKL